MIVALLTKDSNEVAIIFRIDGWQVLGSIQDDEVDTKTILDSAIETR
jgi:hypothetical protein